MKGKMSEPSQGTKSEELTVIAKHHSSFQQNNPIKFAVDYSRA